MLTRDTRDGLTPARNAQRLCSMGTADLINNVNFNFQVGGNSSQRALSAFWTIPRRTPELVTCPNGIRLSTKFSFSFFCLFSRRRCRGGPIWQRVAADCGRHISCHPKQYNNECLLQNAHGTIDMSLALREGHIDAGGMVDQASLKHLQIG